MAFAQAKGLSSGSQALPRPLQTGELENGLVVAGVAGVAVPPSGPQLSGEQGIRVQSRPQVLASTRRMWDCQELDGLFPFCPSVSISSLTIIVHLALGDSSFD